MIPKQRKRLLVDSLVQGAIVKRVFFYWCACLLFVTLPIILMMTVSHPERYWYEHVPVVGRRFWPVFLVMFAMLPFLIRDALELSNRFCGPVVRMRRGLDQFNQHGECDEIKFRDNDFWHPLAKALNQALTRNGKDSGDDTPASS